MPGSSRVSGERSDADAIPKAYRGEGANSNQEPTAEFLQAAAS